MSQSTTDKTFKEDVLDLESPVLVDFWAPWCGPCKLIGPIIDKIAEKVQGKIKIYKVNVDENPEISSEYNILSIPTVIIFKNGKKEKEFVGVQSEKVFDEALSEYLI